MPKAPKGVADRVEAVLRTATPALGGYRDGVEELVCEDLGVDPAKFLARGRGCGCRFSRARGREGMRLCDVYEIPEVRIPEDWSGGFQRPQPAVLGAWRQRYRVE